MYKIGASTDIPLKVLEFKEKLNELDESYSKYEKIDYRRVILFALFATGLAPLVSATMFGLEINYIYSIPLGD